MTPEETDQLATRFFSAIERGDLEGVEACYAPDVAVWHNVTRATQSREENLRLLRAFIRRVYTLRYEEIDRRFFPGGFVQRHVVRGTLGSGAPVEISVCLMIDVAKGRITRIQEYLDSAAIKPVFDDRVELMDPRMLEDWEI